MTEVDVVTKEILRRMLLDSDSRVFEGDPIPEPATLEISIKARHPDDELMVHFNWVEEDGSSCSSGPVYGSTLTEVLTSALAYMQEHGEAS